MERNVKEEIKLAIPELLEEVEKKEDLLLIYNFIHSVIKKQ